MAPEQPDLSRRRLQSRVAVLREGGRRWSSSLKMMVGQGSHKRNMPCHITFHQCQSDRCQKDKETIKLTR